MQVVWQLLRRCAFCLELTVQNYVNSPKLSGAKANISAAGTVFKHGSNASLFQPLRETEFFLEMTH